jgi:hypothetical protein
LGVTAGSRSRPEVKWAVASISLNMGPVDVPVVELPRAAAASVDWVTLRAVIEYKAAAQKILEQLKDLSKQRYVTPYLLGRICAALDESEEALRYLQAAYQQRGLLTVFMKNRS